MNKPGLYALVWYKGRPALVTGPADRGEKITILAGTDREPETIKVREKDIEVLHPGPFNDLTGLAAQNGQEQNYANLREAWELIENGGEPVDIQELAELAYGEFTPKSAWSARLLLADGLFFTGTASAISARSAAELSALEEKRQDRAKENSEREAFLERLRNGACNPAEDGRFLQDVEALAYGKTDKSRTMKELGRHETPQEAHRLFLECGFWNNRVNPYPRRCGLSPGENFFLEKTPAPQMTLERRDLTHFPAFAIDSPWSSDPDDALSLENDRGRHILYVHIADPASVIESGSPGDHHARAMGATLYLPEGTWPMLGEETLRRFALGLGKTPNEALTFKMILNSGGAIEDTEIFPSIIKVTRLSYEEADKLIEEAGEAPLTAEEIKNAAVLRELHRAAAVNLERRLNAGAVTITLPEVHISADGGAVQILPIVPHRSADMVRECMLLAGEGAAAWAAKRRLPFPYIAQETGDLPAKPLPGLAGSVQLRRCMRPRSVSAKTGYHWGLGLDGYSQVTSPLRRYTDLLAHQQIRAFLCKEKGISAPLNEEEVLFCLAEGDAAAQAVTQAERASRSHWTAVYLDELIAGGGELLWDAVVTEKRTNALGIIIPGLGLETQIGGSGSPNDMIKVRLKSVRIPELETNFVQEK
ncbi:MAG: RNB domain-containing ribonuclease [Treponema sp.]|nr:RNB domain-containing ribonuclease [Treponema sp.]